MSFYVTQWLLQLRYHVNISSSWQLSRNPFPRWALRDDVWNKAFEKQKNLTKLKNKGNFLFADLQHFSFISFCCRIKFPWINKQSAHFAPSIHLSRTKYFFFLTAVSACVRVQRITRKRTSLSRYSCKKHLLPFSVGDLIQIAGLLASYRTRVNNVCRLRTHLV